MVMHWFSIECVIYSHLWPRVHSAARETLKELLTTNQLRSFLKVSSPGSSHQHLWLPVGHSRCFTKALQLLSLNCSCRLLSYPFLRNWCHTTWQSDILSLLNKRDSSSSQRDMRTVELQGRPGRSLLLASGASLFCPGDWAQGAPSTVCSWVSQKWPNAAAEDP